MLDAAGWQRGADGVRARDGRKLKFLFQTSTNAPRQKCQQIIKQACQKAGIEVELKAVVAAVFFSSDVANPDTNTKFYADLQMFNISGGTDPLFFMNQFCSWEVASRQNKWQGRNMTRWRSDEYDAAHRAAKGEFDPVKRAALFIAMNDMVIDNRVVIPLVNRPTVAAASSKLRISPSAWDGNLWLLKDWYRDA